MDRDTLAKIVEIKIFDTLIGEIENDWFDCKKEPYQIQNESAKRELAKDVSSFANVGGGYIFIGIRTKQSAQHFGDEVESLHPFSQSLVNTTQYRDVLRTWVYPEIEGLDIRWLETDSTKHTGLVVITIPNQKEATKPFLISKTLDGKKQIETVFGYAQRKGDVSSPHSVVDLQQALRSGLNYGSLLKERFDGVETLIRISVVSALENSDVGNQKKSKGDRIDQRVATTLEYEGLKDGRNVSIVAYPNEALELKTIFLSTPDSIRRKLENPPILRYGGWNLRTLDQAKILRGEMIRVGNGKRIVIDLYRDGTMVFAGQGDHQFLAWHDEVKQKINPVALVEILYEFFAFYSLVLDDFEKRPSEFTARFNLRNLHQGGVKTGLVPFAPGTYGHLFDHDKKEAPDDAMTIQKRFPTEGYDSTAYAYAMAKEIYLWFGLEEDKIPYVKEENGGKFIDVAKIKGI
jgi:Schlafen, AlbA_2